MVTFSGGPLNLRSVRRRSLLGDCDHGPANTRSSYEHAPDAATARFVFCKLARRIAIQSLCQQHRSLRSIDINDVVASLRLGVIRWHGTIRQWQNTKLPGDAPLSAVAIPMARYLEILRKPHVPGVFVVSITARLPFAIAELGILLFIRQLTGSYAEAGLVAGAATLGTAVGLPLCGRLTDRLGVGLLPGSLRSRQLP